MCECIGYLNAQFVIGTSNWQTEEILWTPIRADQSKNRADSDLSDRIGSSLTLGNNAISLIELNLLNAI